MPTKAGYGRVWVSLETVYAHRVAWALAHGPVPAGLYVCHHCDNPPCVNPAHLFIGTASDNARDMAAKGRARNDPRRGTRHALAKLTEADVREIRRRYAPSYSRKTGPNTGPALAREYGVSRSLIHRIVRGESWPHVAAEPR